MKKKNYDYDIVVVGGGFIGLIVSLMLSKKSINVCLIEKRDLSLKSISNGEDKRTTAISQGTKRIFEDLGLWKKISKESQAIKKIKVSENVDEGLLEFDPKRLDEGDLGFIVRNKDLRFILLKSVLTNKFIHIKSKTEVENINLDTSFVSEKAILRTKNLTIKANLVIGADGRYSKIRHLSNIKSYNYDYEQSSYVFNVVHEKDHYGVALERFFPEGPLAILPMKQKWRGFYQSSVVWTVDNDLGNFTDLSLNDFKIEFLKRYQNFFGLVKKITKPTKYPLNVTYAYKAYNSRLVLIGDASQAIHPIAGQGFNLGVRDCLTLSNALIESRLLGMDIGLDETLNLYSRKRAIDKRIFIEATHRLNFLFSNKNAVFKLVRSKGLGLIQKSNFIKKQFMLIAMGLKNIRIN